MLLDYEASLARSTRSTGEGGFTNCTLVTFELAGQVIGVEVEHVREILDLHTLVKLPNATPYCEGLIDARGESIPVVDMSALLGMPRGDAGHETRIIILEITRNDQRKPIGIIAEKVLNVQALSNDQIQPPPHDAVPIDNSHGIIGLARLDGRLCVLLDVPSVLADCIKSRF
ncbi:MAG: chemotaxis protein CheW [Paracoccaceae bacterium]